jgi:hypothetical protein
MVMHAEGKHSPSFKVTFINAKWIYTPLFVLSILSICLFDMSVMLEYLGLQNGFELQNMRMVLPHYIFLVMCVYLIYYSFTRNTSLIPLLALLSCGYLLSESGARNWERFILWLLLGIIIYFGYGQKKSKLA